MINGMNLAEQYYEEFGRAALDKVLSDFPGVKIAAGLVGEGSQCFGFDDEISRDHDFAPGFCIWVSDEDFAAAGSALQKAYDSLPPSYKGISRSNIIADDRLGVMTTGGFYSRFTGCEGAAAMPGPKTAAIRKSIHRRQQTVQTEPPAESQTASQNCPDFPKAIRTGF